VTRDVIASLEEAFKTVLAGIRKAMTGTRFRTITARLRKNGRTSVGIGTVLLKPASAHLLRTAPLGERSKLFGYTELGVTPLQLRWRRSGVNGSQSNVRRA
jgi:hypothetical protein